MGTVLFRPADRSSAFTQEVSWSMAEDLGSRPGVLAVRVNLRRNIVAVDAGCADTLRALLAATEICGLPVRGSEPTPRGQSAGLVFGVDSRRSVEQLTAAVRSPVPIASASLTGST